MANWVAEFLEQNPDLATRAIARLAAHSIHFDLGGGNVVAKFTGAPCHFQDTDGLWKPVDTALVEASGGFYGCLHSDVKVHPDGRVRIDNSDYQQYTELPGAPIGLVDNDRIIREFSGGRQIMNITENGYREEIILDTLPLLNGAAASKYLSQVTGSYLPKYEYSGTVITDANSDIFTFTGDLTAFRKWMQSAAYPVVIDPDFSVGSTDKHINGRSTSFNTARNTSYGVNTTGNTTYVGIEYSTYYYVYRAYQAYNTSSIGSNPVGQVNLWLASGTPQSQTFDLQIVKYNWNGAAQEAAYDGALSSALDDNIWKNTANISADTMYSSGNLSTAWINTSGTTYYALRSSDDTNNTSRTAGRLAVRCSRYATVELRPVLSVVYVTCPAKINTVNGIAIASAKTFNGIASASTKSVNGIA
jgi:hypothetical protein